MTRSLTGILLLFVLASTAQPASIDGAGSTFLAPIYQRWIETFLSNRPQDHIRYEPVGSGLGLQRLAERKIDFAGSDVCQPAAGSPAGEELCLPVAAGAVVPIFNVPGVAHDLRLTPQALTGIYSGAIKRWNDLAIQQSNRAVRLPDREIVVVHRADSSGTTYTFTDYLSKIDAAWRASVGTGTAVSWPAGRAATGNEGVAELVEKTPGAIGYVEFLFALRHHLGMIAVRNAAGHYTLASLETVTAAAESAQPSFRMARPASTITNGAASNAYPLSTFSWVVVPANVEDADRRKLLLEFLDWILDSGQRQAAGLGYVAIPENVIRDERAVLVQLRDGIAK
jgi:phosphate transport system substrate-binding protein